MIAFAQWIDAFAPADPGAQPQVFVVTTSLSYLSWFHVVRTSFYLGEHLGQPTLPARTSRRWCDPGCSRSADILE